MNVCKNGGKSVKCRYLDRQFPGWCEYESKYAVWVNAERLDDRESESQSLSRARFRRTDHIFAFHDGRNAVLLDRGGTCHPQTAALLGQPRVQAQVVEVTHNLEFKLLQ